MSAIKPLKSRRIIVTRPVDSSAGPDRLIRRLADAGAICLHVPLIETAAVSETENMDDVLDRLAQFGTIVFVSPNGVRYLIERISHRGKNLDLLQANKIGSIGPGTSQSLEGCGLNVSFEAVQNNSKGMAHSILENQTGKPVLLVRGNRGSLLLNEILESAGVEFESVVAYESKMRPGIEPKMLAELETGQWDWVTITSSEIARAAIELLGSGLKQVQIASLGPAITKILESAGHRATVESKVQNFDGLVQGIVEFEINQR